MQSLIFSFIILYIGNILPTGSSAPGNKKNCLILKKTDMLHYLYYHTTILILVYNL